MLRILLALASAFVGGLLAVNATAAPLEAYGRLPSLEQVSISPDGQKLAVILSDGIARKVLIRNLVDGSNKVLGVGDQKVRWLDWAGPNHLVITVTITDRVAFVSGGRAEYAMTQDYNLATGKLRALGGDIPNSMNVAASLPVVRTVGDKPIIFLEGVHFSGNYGQDSLFQIDPETGRSKLVPGGYPSTNDWLVGPDGKPLAQAEYEPSGGRWKLRIAQPLGWQVVKTLEGKIERPWIVGLGRDGRSVLVAEPLGEKTALREISPDNPAWPEPFLTEPFRDPIYDPANHKLIGFVDLVGDEMVYQFFEPADTSAWAKIQRAYSGKHIRLVSWSSDRSKVVILVDSPTEGASYALVDFQARRADPIGPIYEKLASADISLKKPIRFKAKDGLDLSGDLTLPNGREAKGLPLVVLVHGGPESRDDPGFDWWSQAIASRGYAVLQVNYRGSGGFGRAFVEAGFGQWGRKMQTDVSDGVRYLAVQGTIDAKRVCITGASYGGYATLAGAALNPGVYRCAAAVSGPADIHRMVTWSRDHNGIVSERYWTRFMGAEDPKDPVLDEISPALHADQVDIPVLLIHGRDDTVVALEQTQIMERALKAAGKSVEVVIQPGEDHWLSRGETRLQMLTSVVAFLEKHNPPQ